MTQVRTRRRAVQVGTQVQSGPTITAEMRTEVERLHVANKAKNAAGSTERKAQEELNRLMAQASGGVDWEFDHSFTRFTTDGESVPKTITVDVTYAQGSKETIDLETLKGMVDEETFLKCIAATKGRVKDNAGSNVVATCTRSVPGEWKATVKAR